MRRRTIDFNTVRTIGRRLPGSEEGTTYGTPALKVNGNAFTCIPTNKAAEPGSLAVWVPFATRDELLEAEPDTYYVKEHYMNYPVVLVRLSRIREDALSDLLRLAWEFVRTKPKAKRDSRPKAKRYSRAAR